MIKHFCDCCEKEITDENNGKFMEVKKQTRGGRTVVGILKFQIEGKESDFDLCKYCVLDVIAKYDDRPQASK